MAINGFETAGETLARIDRETHAVFVYGTLRPGERNAYLLGRNCEYRAAVAPGRLGKFGALYGWRADGSTGTPGFVVWVDADALERMDTLEGTGYRRVRIAALTRDGSVECWAYEWTGEWGPLEELRP